MFITPTADATESQSTSTTQHDLVASLEHLTSLKEEVEAKRKWAVSHPRSYEIHQLPADKQDQTFASIRAEFLTMWGGQTNVGSIASDGINQLQIQLPEVTGFMFPLNLNSVSSPAKRS